MKKVLYLISIFALIIFFNGCEKEESQTILTTEGLSVEQAKAYIDAETMSQFTLKSGGLEKQSLGIKANWDKSIKSSNNEEWVVETQIMGQGRFGFATAENMAIWKSTGSKEHISSMSRLVVIKKKKSGEIYSFIMSIAGEKQYIEQKNFKLWDNTYHKRDKDLSGYVLFHTLSGKFVNGWIYCDGVITNSIIDSSDLDLSLQLKSTAEMAIYEWVEYCTDYYTIGSVDGVIVSLHYTGSSCSQVREYVGSYTPGGGITTGGGISNNTGGGYIPTTPTNPTLPPCPCTDVCPVCHKCKDTFLLKSASPDCTPAAVCTCAPEIDLTPSFKSNTKVMCVYSNLVGTAVRNYNPLVTTFLANFSDGLSFNPGDVLFDVGALEKDEYGKCTSYEYNDKSTITLNQTYIDNRAPLELAKTMMHEILHAKMFHSRLVTPGSFDTMFMKYVGATTGNSVTDEHLLMENFYVSPMIRFLKDYDSLSGNIAPDEYYEAIAISGMKLNYSSSELIQIKNAEIFFRNRGLNCP